MLFKKVAIFLGFVSISSVGCSNRRPNIIIFMADDLGRNDVGYHGSSQISTPNIDALGYNGIVLNKHYTMHICTPSRAALLTGNYPIRSGMQGFPLVAGEPRALPVNMATIAERLLSLGYSTHLVGKWHLGHENRSVTPTGRGFQTFFGYWSGPMGYFDYEVKENNYGGFDLHRNFDPAVEHIGTYATNLFTNEAISLINQHNRFNPLFMMVNHMAPHTGKNGYALEVPNPEEADEKYSYIEEPERRLYADMVNRLDTSIGQVVQALSQRGMMQNTILLFMSDNGGPTVGLYRNYASNWPFRGIKLTLFEGAIRNPAVIWSKLLKNKHYVENTVIHITDWLPTLYAAAGGKVADLGKIDGINHWPLLSRGKTSSRRKDILLNIDEVTNYSAILSSDGHYKLTQGTYLSGYDGYYGDSGKTNYTPKYDIASILNSGVNQAILDSETWPPLTEKIIRDMRNSLKIKELDVIRENLTCNQGYCLFDLWNDPTETTDILMSAPEVVKQLNASLEAYRKELVPQTNKKFDSSSDPALCGGSWFPWLDSNIKCVVNINSFKWSVFLNKFSIF